MTFMHPSYFGECNLSIFIVPSQSFIIEINLKVNRNYKFREKIC